MSKAQVPPPPDSDDPPRWALDLKAKNEEKNWDDESKLRGQKNKNDLWWLRVYGFLVIAVTVVFTLLFLAGLVIWVLHYLLPNGANDSSNLTWLTPEQLSKIQSIIFSGSLGAIVSAILQKQLSK